MRESITLQDAIDALQGILDFMEYAHEAGIELDTKPFVTECMFVESLFGVSIYWDDGNVIKYAERP